MQRDDETRVFRLEDADMRAMEPELDTVQRVEWSFEDAPILLELVRNGLSRLSEPIPKDEDTDSSEWFQLGQSQHRTYGVLNVMRIELEKHFTDETEA